MYVCMSECFRLSIGNALGYVRMVRSASMFYCSEAVKYLPDFEEIIKFETFAGSTGEGRFAFTKKSLCYCVWIFVYVCMYVCMYLGRYVLPIYQNNRHIFKLY